MVNMFTNETHEFPLKSYEMRFSSFFLFQKARSFSASYGGLVTKMCPILTTSRSVACQAPLFMGFPRQEYWSGLPFPSPGDLSNPGIEPSSRFFIAESPGKPFQHAILMIKLPKILPYLPANRLTCHNFLYARRIQGQKERTLLLTAIAEARIWAFPCDHCWVLIPTEWCDIFARAMGCITAKLLWA